MTSSVHTEVRDHVLRVTIDRPEAKNAIDESLARALAETFDGASTDTDVHVVLLGSTGDVFLSGGDLSALRSLPRDGRGADAVTKMGERLAAIENCAVPVIAAVQGPAYGGGCELLLMTDIVVIDAAATLHFVHRLMGLVPAWGGCTRLIERVGAARAADILLSARPVPADEAAKIGLVSRVVRPGKAVDEAGQLAMGMARAPRDALVRIKASLAAARGAGRAETMAAEQKVFRAAWGQPPHEAAMQRFFNR